MKKYFTVLFLFLHAFIHADAILIDLKMSPYAHAQNTLTVENQLLKLSDKLSDSQKNWLKYPLYEEDLSFKMAFHHSSSSPHAFFRCSKVPLRFLELTFIWAPVNFCGEFFQLLNGLYYRNRDLKNEFAFNLDRFKLDSMFGDMPHYSNFQTGVFISAHYEASQILALQLENQWVSQQFLDARLSSLYLLSQLTSRWIDLENVSKEDYQNYLSTIDEYLPSLGSGILFNPFCYYAVASNLSYIFFNTGLPIKGIPCFGYQFLPVYQWITTAYGDQSVYRAYIWGGNFAPLSVYLGHLYKNFSQCYQFGIKSDQILRTPVGNFGFQVDVWGQKRFIDEPKSGAAASLIYQYPFFNGIKSYFLLQAGYKSKGYLAGESLYASPILRLGFNYIF